MNHRGTESTKKKVRKKAGDRVIFAGLTSFLLPFSVSLWFNLEKGFYEK